MNTKFYNGKPGRYERICEVCTEHFLGSQADNICNECENKKSAVCLDEPHHLMIVGSGPSALKLLGDEVVTDDKVIVAINHAWMLFDPFRVEWWHRSHDYQKNKGKMPLGINVLRADIRSWGYRNRYCHKRPETFYEHDPQEPKTTLFLDVLCLVTTMLPKTLSEITFYGCEHNYSTSQPHFYGTGTSDPLRYGEEFLVRYFKKFRDYAIREQITLHSYCGPGILESSMFGLA